jgi:hypothetical protein
MMTNRVIATSGSRAGTVRGIITARMSANGVSVKWCCASGSVIFEALRF